MRRFANTLMAAGTLGTAIMASPTSAGGLWLNEFGDFAGGRASAGAVAGVDEASVIIHNPAGATRIEGSQLFGTLGALIPTVEFDIDYTNPISGNDNGGGAGLDAPAAGAAYVHDTGSDAWSAGIYLAGLSGAGLEYNSNWVGRFQSTEVQLLLMVLAPTVAYRVTDSFSIGASLQYYYSTLDLKARVPTRDLSGQGRVELDGDDDGFAYTLGALWELSPTTRIGLKYQSEIEADYDGKLKVKAAENLRVDSSTELTVAQFLRLGLHHDVNDRLGLDFTVGWDDWSALDNVFLSVPDREAGLEKNWGDTYHYAAGVQYRLEQDWDLTAGISYDTNPVDARDRTADLPVDRQVRYNMGARHRLRDNLTVGGYVNYTDLGSAKIRGRFWGGEYKDNYVFSFALYINWLM